MNDTTDIASRSEVVAVTGEIDELESYTKNYAVKTAEQYTAGADDLRRVKAAQKRLEDTRTGMTKPINESLKRINDFFRKPAERLATVERAIKSALGTYAQAEEDRRRKEQAEADERARKEREKIEQQAAKAAAAGKVEKAEELQQRAATVVAPVVTREPPKAAGVSMRDHWCFEVVDAAQVPRQYCSVDESKIRKVVQALKSDASIPGVRVWCEKRPAASAAA